MTSTKSARGLASRSSKKAGERATLRNLEPERKGGRVSATGSRSTSRRRENPGAPRRGLVNTIDLAGQSDGSGSGEAEESSAEADDEDDTVLSVPRQLATSKGNGNGKGVDALNRGRQKAEGFVPDRPPGRLWLDHVAVPTSSQVSTSTPKKRQSILLTFRDSPRTVKTRQSSLNSYFGGSVASTTRAAPAPNRSRSGATTSSKANQSRDSSATKGKAPESKDARFGSPVSREPGASSVSDSSSDVVITSAAKFHPRRGRPTAAVRPDTDSESSYTDKESGSVKLLDDDENENMKVPAPKRGMVTKTKVLQTTLFGSKASTGGGESAKAKKRNQDSWTYKGGINEDLPPLNDIGEIFDDMVKKLAGSGIKGMAGHLGSRKLKVATMCSGTESPILALGLIAESMKKHFGLDFEIDHLFSAEIVPFKQAYIERNFSPPIIFRDIKELIDSDREATTAYGAMATIPGDVDLLVAGFSCVDFSQLNSHKLDLSDPGESGDTFRAILNYAKKWRPSIIVLENVSSAPWELIKGYWRSHANYSAEWLRVDTKAYYIPHTRIRGYMICIDNEKLGSSNEAVGKWKRFLETMKRPASCPIEAFLLPEDDPRVHRGREELSKGLRGGDKNAREVDWTRCQGRHQDYRADLLLGSKRPMTGWEDNGSCKMPDFCWNDWGTTQVERIWDTFEVSLLRNARRGFDSQYKTFVPPSALAFSFHANNRNLSRVWELSQNIDRFTDTTPFGITGCITPTGVPYVTIRGGPMIGLEALAMQGLPIERLLLTREHQRQLQDLAGNAMSTTVVGAAMLGALIVGYKALEPGYGEKMVVDISRDVTKNICGTDHLVEDVLDLATFKETSVASILRDAGRSSRLCLCEGRALMTPNRLQQCKQCYHTTCLKCGGNPKHDYALLPTDLVDSRIPPGKFENSLKDTLPMRVRVAGISGKILEDLKNTSDIEVKDWALLTRAIEPALGAELRFHSLKRAEAWTVFYESPTSRMELVLDSRQAEWRLFAKPSKRENVNSNVRKLLARPFARMRPIGNNLVDGKWQFCFPTELNFKIKIEGRGKAVRSWESKLGLQEPKFADKKLWSTLHLSVDEETASRLDMDISGDYKFLPDCGTAAGCLHKRIALQEGGDDDTALFLFLDPSRYGNPVEDYFVFSTDIRRYNYGEQRPIVARADPRWRPLHSFSEQTVKCTADGQWIHIKSAEFKTISSNAKTTYATPSPDMNIEFASSSCSAANAILSCKVPLPESEEVGWTKGEWIEVDKLSERTVFSSFAWLTERVRHIKDFGTWRPVDIPQDFDRCQICAPSPPKVKWRRVEKEKLEPFEDPQQAAPYERALKNRPPPFLTHIRIDDNNLGLLKIGLNISSLIHRAASNLPQRGSALDVELSWRLTTDYVPPPRVVLPKFDLCSNKKDPSCDQPPHFKMALRPEQLRSLSWMRRQEAKDAAPFKEEEIEEALLPHLGWRAEGRATKNIAIRGGVLADQVGYGKTATTLGLIDSQFPGEEKSLGDIPGKIPLKATLIIVPHTLLNQWGNEIKKFLGSTYNVVSIKDTRQLSAHKISDFQNADIIITNWSVLNNENYYTKLAHFAALPDMPSGTGRAFGAWYTYALQRVAEHVDVLRENGADALEQTLEAKLKSFENDEELVKYVPSKRLRGTAYRKAQLAKAEEAHNPKLGGKRKADDISLSDSELPRRKAPSDPFLLRDANVRRNWKRMQNPLFQMFHFNRLVVDEYTYVGGNDHTSITSLQANVRWVLSGTPPLGDFADVKTISVFLGINLGIDDDAVGVIQAHNIKAMGKDRTAVEEFQSFRQVHSPAWHQRRHEHAQEFLDQFVRQVGLHPPQDICIFGINEGQNIAEIDEIPFDETLRCIELPAAEKAIYMELHHHLLSQEMRIRKGKSKMESDREKRLNQTIGDSKTPEEALVKRCCHFTLDDLTTNRENATQACDLIVAERENQYQDLILDLEKNLKLAVWLKRRCGDDDEHYDGWKRNVGVNAFGDLSGTKKLKKLIQQATDNYDAADGDLFYKDVDKVELEEKKMAKKAAAKKAASAKKAAKRRRVDGNEGENPATNYDDDDGSSDDIRQPWPVTRAEHVQALRNLTSHLRRLCKELVSRIRSLRFFKVVRDLQLKESGLLDDKETPAGCVCSKCKRGFPASMLSVLSLCGHVACDECMNTWGRSDECIVSGCDAAARSFHVVRAVELGQEDEVARIGRHYGRKLEQMIHFIRNDIPKDDQVLLFVQFDDLMEKVSKALDDHGISHYALTKGMAKKAANLMSLFQETTSSMKKKVLVLNIADESASGANLTNANHIIFLSPLLTETQYHYDASTTQAIGRARRYGQKKLVHIHRFLALKTIDVDIIQERTAKRLVSVGKAYDLKPENEVDPGTASLGSWMTRREKVQSDTE